MIRFIFLFFVIAFVVYILFTHKPTKNEDATSPSAASTQYVTIVYFLEHNYIDAYQALENILYCYDAKPTWVFEVFIDATISHRLQHILTKQPNCNVNFITDNSISSKLYSLSTLTTKGQNSVIFAQPNLFLGSKVLAKNIDLWLSQPESFMSYENRSVWGLKSYQLSQTEKEIVNNHVDKAMHSKPGILDQYYVFYNKIDDMMKETAMIFENGKVKELKFVPRARMTLLEENISLF